MEETGCKMYIQKHSEINGYGIWHYLISTPIGNISVVEYEGPGHGILRKIYDENYDKAEREYTRALKKMITQP